MTLLARTRAARRDEPAPVRVHMAIGTARKGAERQPGSFPSPVASLTGDRHVLPAQGESGCRMIEARRWTGPPPVGRMAAFTLLLEASGMRIPVACVAGRVGQTREPRGASRTGGTMTGLTGEIGMPAGEREPRAVVDETLNGSPRMLTMACGTRHVELSFMHVPVTVPALPAQAEKGPAAQTCLVRPDAGIPDETPVMTCGTGNACVRPLQDKARARMVERCGVEPDDLEIASVMLLVAFHAPVRGQAAVETAPPADPDRDLLVTRQAFLVVEGPADGMARCTGPHAFEGRMRG